MADPKALYSYQGQEPQLLPHEISWVEEWGQITYRTDVSSFTDEELAKAGYVGPYEIPSIDIDYERRYWDSKKLKYVVEKISEQELWKKIREKRNFLLSECDWTMAADAPESLNFREWEMYRQRLRDITTTFAHPKDVVWPVSPEGLSDEDFELPRLHENRILWRVRDLEQMIAKIKESINTSSTNLPEE